MMTRDGQMQRPRAHDVLQPRQRILQHVGDIRKKRIENPILCRRADVVDKGALLNTLTSSPPVDEWWRLLWNR